MASLSPWRFLSPDAYTPGAAGAPEVTSGGTVTAANWRKMQLQGCVFLPCAGGNNGGSNVGVLAYYWASDPRGNLYGYSAFFHFTNKTVQPSNGLQKKTNRFCVRLVRTL